jgi:crotonobetainyl-CoA:carnitine CoA-transferase CaiB-like acyl-CoA transferase
MGVTGPEEGPPCRVGVSIVDITTGMFASTAILAALRAREESGFGQLLDLSLMDSIVALLANVASNYLVGRTEPKRMGNAHFNIAPYEVFRARDRWITLGALNDRQWGMLCDFVEMPELKDDPRFADNHSRVTNREELAEILNRVFSTRDAEEWLGMLQQAGIPSGPINAVQDVFNHPQREARELVQYIQHPTAGEVAFPGFPYKFSETPAQLLRPPPMLGEHTNEVLIGLLGYSKQKVASLKEAGII